MSRLLNVTGRVRIACITAREDQWRQERPDELQFLDGASYLRKLVDPRSGKVIGQIALDSNMYDRGSQLLVHCLLCSVRKKDHKWQLTCLGLLPTDLTLEEFVRIGLVSIYD